MMNKNKLLLTLFFSILVFSCSTDNSSSSNSVKQYSEPAQALTADSTNSNKNKSQQQNWNINYLQSGGIAGLMDSIKIDHIGRLTSFDEKLNKITIKQVSKNDITQLYQMLLAIEENKNPKKNQPQRRDSMRSPCFDCITNSLNVEFLTHRYKVNFEMMPSTNNEYRKIADKILEINNKLQQ